MQAKLLLASSSPSRRLLLQQMGLKFECFSPDVDESARPEETPLALVHRLSELKAHAGVAAYPEHICIAGDQVAALDGVIYGKPHTHAAAVAQLKAFSNRRLTFYSGVCVKNPHNQQMRTAVIPTEVNFLDLSEATIAAYLAKEDVLKCAGSFRSEGLATALIASMRSDDPNAIIGMPLITLAHLLKQVGYDVLAD